MISLSAETIHEKFAEYYQNEGTTLSIPSEAEKREFGFLLFKKRTMLRHKKFEDVTRLKKLLGSLVPSDVYYSSAYFDDPEREMEGKGWLGSDLVFDIDADHVPTPCGRVHDSWVCYSCGFAGKGPSPVECPRCGEARFDSKTWTCEVCLESAKGETKKLLDMLIEDFGFAADELAVYFSGNRGYHVHVESKTIRLLDSIARKEIVDYIVGLGFKSELYGLIREGRVMLGPSSGRTGWRVRVADGIRETLIKAKQTELKRLGLSKRAVEFIVKNEQNLLERLNDKGRIDVKDLGIKNWKKIINNVVDLQSSKIDTVVTTDIHRLIRLGGSLHGKTGFKKVEVPVSSLDQFDPLKEAVAFRDGQMIVNITEAPKFRVGYTHYGPFKNVFHKELPTAAAVFLLCKGAAQIVG